MEIAAASKSIPTREGWLIAFASLAGVLLFCVLQAYFIERWQENLAKAEIKECLQTGDTTGARQIFGELIDSRSSLLISGFRSVIFGSKMNSRRSHLQELLPLFDIMLFLKNEETELARSRFLLLTEGEYFRSQLQGASQDILTDCRELFEKDSKLITDSEEIKGELARFSAEEVAINQRFVEVRRSFASLLSLSIDETTQTSLEFYGSGVLEGLPTLEGLHDGFPSLAELRTELAFLGGEVKIAGDPENIHEAFLAKISSIRDETHKVKESENQLKAKEDSLNEAMRRNQTERGKVRRKLIEHFREIIKELL